MCGGRRFERFKSYLGVFSYVRSFCSLSRSGSLPNARKFFVARLRLAVKLDGIKTNRDKFLANKKSSSSKSRGNNHRNGSNNSTNSGSNNSSGSSSTQDVSTIPPKAGKPHVCILSSGKVVYWCQLCSKWNNSHETRFHSDNNALNVRSESNDNQSQSGVTLSTQPDDSANPNSGQHVTDIGGAVRGSFGPPHFL